MFLLITILLSLAGLTGCVKGNDVTIYDVTHPAVSRTLLVTPQATFTPSPTSTIKPSPQASMEPTSSKIPAVWISPVIPEEYLNLIQPSSRYKLVDSVDGSDFSFEVLVDPSSEETQSCTAEWVYAVVVPFPTINDEIAYRDIQQAWFGEKENPFGNTAPLMTQETHDIFKSIWGEPAVNGFKIIEQSDLLEYAWEEQPAWAIIPFEQLEPRWKVLAVDGMSPLDTNLDTNLYPLALHFCFIQTPGKDDSDWTGYINDFRGTNRDPEKMTSVVLTGTTALVRNLAFKMETHGINYPAEKIKNWLQGADILHISNEVSFFEDCPPAVPVYRESRFCSNPRYMDLLMSIGVDVIELTGNHLFDWGKEPFLQTLDLYEENMIPFYGGGRNLELARKPLLIEHNGNRFAFIGCSPAGPENVWATEVEPGTATCDFEWIGKEIDRLEKSGYIPIFTFQHFESDDYVPHSSQRVDFNNIAQAGAQIVSGSQSHFPQGMTFVGDEFIHYGLGNLFFDQMEPLKRDQFIDRHIFYDGRYISTELLTSVLEDYSQPRPMLPAEREKFLKKGICSQRMVRMDGLKKEMMKKIYDISVSIAQDLPVWPGDPQVILERTSDLDAGDEANVTFLKMSAHTGTHLDAPNHFLSNGITVDEINPEVLIGPAQVVAIPDNCSRITSGIISKISMKTGIERILFKTINSSFWEKNADFQKGFTAITADGAQSLVEKNLKLVGVDYLSISPFEDTVTPHRIFLEAGVIILEGINLSQVPEGIYELICLPLKIKRRGWRACSCCPPGDGVKNRDYVICELAG